MSLSPFSLSTLPDDTLLERLRELARRDCDLEADLLVHLGEVDARRLYLSQGFPSLFAYCVEMLHFSESVAYHRIAAARGARAFPVVLERVRSGEIHLSGLRLLLPHLTAENHGEWLDRARYRSKRAIEEMLADRTPKPDALPQVRRIAVRPASPAPRGLQAALAPGTAPISLPSRAVSMGPPPSDKRDCEPLGESRFKIQFTAGSSAHAKLREAQALLRHPIPDGDLARIFERALDALLREVRRTSSRDRPSARGASGLCTVVPPRVPAHSLPRSSALWSLETANAAASWRRGAAARRGRRSSFITRSPSRVRGVTVRTRSPCAVGLTTPMRRSRTSGRDTWRASDGEIRCFRYWPRGQFRAVLSQAVSER